MTINLQRRITELRKPGGRGCPGDPRRDDDILALLDALEEATAENRRLKRQLAFKAPASLEGDNQTCHFCKKPCSAFAGNPSEWPIALVPIDSEPGVVAWHHTGCVTERLASLVAATKVIEAARWAMLAAIDPDSDPGTLAIVRPLAAEELVRAMTEWDGRQTKGHQPW
jgi:hypothetical protein